MAGRNGRIRRSAVPFSLAHVADRLVCYYCSEYLADSFTHQRCQHTVCGLCSAGRRDKLFCRTCVEEPAMGGPLMSISLVHGRNELIDGLAKTFSAEAYDNRIETIKATDLSAHLTAVRPPASLHRSKETVSIYEQVKERSRTDDSEGISGVFSFWTRPSALCCLGSLCCGCILHPIGYLIIALLRRMRKCVALVVVLLALGVILGLVQMFFTGDARLENLLAQLLPQFFNVTNATATPVRTTYNLSDIL